MLVPSASSVMTMSATLIALKRYPYLPGRSCGVGQRHRRGFVDVGDRDRQRRGVIRGRADRKVIDLDGDVQDRVGLKKSATRKSSAPGRVASAPLNEGVRPERIIGDHDVRLDLEQVVVVLAAHRRPISVMVITRVLVALQGVDLSVTGLDNVRNRNSLPTMEQCRSDLGIVCGPVSSG